MKSKSGKVSAAIKAKEKETGKKVDWKTANTLKYCKGGKVKK